MNLENQREEAIFLKFIGIESYEKHFRKINSGILPRNRLKCFNLCLFFVCYSADITWEYWMRHLQSNFTKPEGCDLELWDDYICNSVAGRIAFRNKMSHWLHGLYLGRPFAYWIYRQVRSGNHEIVNVILEFCKFVVWSQLFANFFESPIISESDCKGVIVNQFNYAMYHVIKDLAVIRKRAEM